MSFTCIECLKPAANKGIWCDTCRAKLALSSANIKAQTIEIQSESLEGEEMKKQPINCYFCKQETCSSCKVCETPECMGNNKLIKSKLEAMKLGLFEAKTQKAQGYIALSKHGLVVPNPFVVVSEENDIMELTSYFKQTMMVRPCPVRPRHGFEESRAVDYGDTETIRGIWNAAKIADPEAELLIAPYINATRNAVITPSLLTIGSSNDGATAGKNVVQVPLIGSKFAELVDNPDLLTQAGITEEDDPYFEAVTPNGNRWLITQLRAGPKIGGGSDYIPETVKVRRVIQANGSLLEWETTTKALSEGTVVDHSGGALSSHYGVHCILNKVPVMTSRAPLIGEILEATSKVPEMSAEAFVRGLGLGLSHTSFTSNSNAVRLMLVIAHNSPAMYGEHAMLAGFAVGVMMVLGTAASIGEARHATMKGYRQGRSDVYVKAINDFLQARKDLESAQWLFENLKWTEGFGGLNWARCTRSIINMDNSIREFLKPMFDASFQWVSAQYSINRILSDLNVAVNEAHNGGWWLDKFCEKQYFELASTQNLMNILNNVSNIMALVEYNGLGFEESKLKEWAEAGPIEAKMPDFDSFGGLNTEKVGMHYAPNEDDDEISSEPYEEPESDTNEDGEPEPVVVQKKVNVLQKISLNGFTPQHIYALQVRPAGHESANIGPIELHLQFRLNEGYQSCDVLITDHIIISNIRETWQASGGTTITTFKSYGSHNNGYHLAFKQGIDWWCPNLGVRINMGANFSVTPKVTAGAFYTKQVEEQSSLINNKVSTEELIELIPEDCPF